MDIVWLAVAIAFFAGSTVLAALLARLQSED